MAVGARACAAAPERSRAHRGPAGPFPHVAAAHDRPFRGVSREPHAHRAAERVRACHGRRRGSTCRAARPRRRRGARRRAPRRTCSGRSSHGTRRSRRSPRPPADDRRAAKRSPSGGGGRRGVRGRCGRRRLHHPAEQWASSTSLPHGLTTSTARDVAAGRPSELDAIVGGVVRAGQRLGVPTPTLEELLAQCPA